MDVLHVRNTVRQAFIIYLWGNGAMHLLVTDAGDGRYADRIQTRRHSPLQPRGRRDHPWPLILPQSHARNTGVMSTTSIRRQSKFWDKLHGLGTRPMPCPRTLGWETSA